jgi:uncharacterized surface protein with fasciclin (FAS1) repeats
VKKIIIGVIIFSGSAVFTFNRCNKNPNSTVVPATPLSIINDDPSLSIFLAIESLSGDDNDVNNSAAIIIPVDSAFINAGITASVAARLTPPECDSIVMYYTIPDGVNFNDSVSRQKAFSSGLGPVLFGDSTKTVLYFDGIPAVSTKHILACRSSIYKLTQFINVPAETVSQITGSDTSLSMFNEAFNRTNLEASLSSGSFTLFMPTNNAFRKAGYPDISSIDSANINTLTKTLLYQTVPYHYFYNDLANQTSLITLQGGTLQVFSKDTLMLLRNANQSSLAILLNNGMLAGNVLTYKISSLLLPSR